MDLISVLILYVLVVLISFSVFYFALKLTGWSAFNIAIIFGLVFLLIMWPPQKLNRRTHPNVILLYMLILLLTPVILFIYVLSKALFDFRPGAICTDKNSSWKEYCENIKL